MRNVAAIVIAVSVAVAGCAGGRVTKPNSSSAALPVSLIGEIDRELSAMRVTHYQHNTQVDEANGSFKYDCSGLLDYALSRALPDSLHALPHDTSARPLAGDIERYLRRGLSGSVNGWRAIVRVDELSAGDVVTWLATEDSKTGDTGHVMVVRSEPVRNSKRPHEWLVEVADSTLSPHARDSRHEGETGLGTGTIGLVVDDRGAADAFYWKGAISERPKSTEIALGRPT